MAKAFLVILLSLLTSFHALAQMECAPFFPRESQLDRGVAGTYVLVADSCVHDDGTTDAWANELYKVLRVGVSRKTASLQVKAVRCGKSQPCDQNFPVTYATSLQYLAQTASQTPYEWPVGGQTCQLPYEITLKRNISALADLVERYDELKSNYGLRMNSNILKFAKNGTLEWHYKTYDSLTSPMLSWFTRNHSKCVFVRKN